MKKILNIRLIKETPKLLFWMLMISLSLLQSCNKNKYRWKPGISTPSFYPVGGPPEGFIPRVEKSYLESNLNIRGKELESHFKDDIQTRFYDSEHNIFFQNDKDLQLLFNQHGKKNVQVLEIHLQTLYEPCPSCQKQILIRQEMYKIKNIKVEAVRYDDFGHVQNNNDLKKLGIIKS